jgi:hypothetical protein
MILNTLRHIVEIIVLFILALVLLWCSGCRPDPVPPTPDPTPTPTPAPYTATNAHWRALIANESALAAADISSLPTPNPQPAPEPEPDIGAKPIQPIPPKQILAEPPAYSAEPVSQGQAVSPPTSAACPGGICPVQAPQRTSFRRFRR